MPDAAQGWILEAFFSFRSDWRPRPALPFLSLPLPGVLSLVASLLFAAATRQP